MGNDCQQGLWHAHARPVMLATQQLSSPTHPCTPAVPPPVLVLNNGRGQAAGGAALAADPTLV